MKRRLIGPLLLLVVALPWLATPGSAARADTRSCGWTVKVDPTLVNVAYPDQSARYWLLTLPAAPGTSLVIRGEYPHSRYISFTSYDQQLRSIDGINDQAIQPDPGSTDPFLPGASRTAAHRSYTVRIVDGQKPAQPAPNTVYTESADGSRQGADFSVIYRNYREDTGLDQTGGVGLPSVSISSPAGETPIPACDSPDVPDPGVNAVVNDAAGVSSATATSTDPIVWHKFVNLPTSAAQATGSSTVVGVTRSTPAGGFLDNLDNKYIATTVLATKAPVVVVHGELPTFADTHPGPAIMPGGVQLRYWSLCTNEVATQRYYGCVPDDEVPLHGDRQYTIMISTPANRPANATAACGVAWLPMGPAPDTLLIMRNMLPAASFTHSVQAATYGEEVQDMGAYYPASVYASVAQAQALGCLSSAAGGGAAAGGAAAGGTGGPVTTSSAVRVTATKPRGTVTRKSVPPAVHRRRVGPAPRPAGTLASTGADPLLPTGAAALIGGALLARRRRGRRDRPGPVGWSEVSRLPKIPPTPR